MTNELQVDLVVGSLNRVIIKPDPIVEKTDGGIHIPVEAQERPNRGTVVAVSQLDNDGMKPTVKAGDKVFYFKYGWTEFNFKGQVVIIGRENEVIAVDTEVLPHDIKTMAGEEVTVEITKECYPSSKKNNIKK